MQVKSYTFQSPYPNQVQVGRADSSNTQNEKTNEETDKITQENNDTLKSNYMIDGYGNDVLVNSSNTFILSNNKELIILNTDKTIIDINKTLTFNSNVFNMKIDGDYLYIARWDGMSIVSLSSLSSVGNYTSTDKNNFKNLAIDGDKLYLTGSNGFEVIDISNKSNPKLTLSYPIINNSNGVASDDTKIYVEDNGYLKVLDKTILLHDFNATLESNLTFGSSVGYSVVDENATLPPPIFEPFKLGSYDTSGSASGVTLSSDGTKAFVTDSSSGLQIIDITTPSSPALLGTYDTR